MDLINKTIMSILSPNASWTMVVFGHSVEKMAKICIIWNIFNISVTTKPILKMKTPFERQWSTLQIMFYTFFVKSGFLAIILSKISKIWIIWKMQYLGNYLSDLEYVNAIWKTIKHSKNNVRKCFFFKIGV